MLVILVSSCVPVGVNAMCGPSQQGDGTGVAGEVGASVLLLINGNDIYGPSGRSHMSTVLLLIRRSKTTTTIYTKREYGYEK